LRLAPGFLPSAARGANAERFAGLIEEARKNQMQVVIAEASLFNDQTVARMGAALGAPVGDVALVNISSELIAINPDIACVRPGVAHAT